MERVRDPRHEERCRGREWAVGTCEIKGTATAPLGFQWPHHCQSSQAGAFSLFCERSRTKETGAERQATGPASCAEHGGHTWTDERAVFTVDVNTTARGYGECGRHVDVVLDEH